MSFFEVDACIAAHLEQFHTSWEQTRILCFNIVCASPGRSGDVDIKKLMPFPWDKAEEVIRPTLQDKKRMEYLIPKTS